MRFIFTIVSILLIGCNSESRLPVTNLKDYNDFLSQQNQPTRKAIQQEIGFWEGKLTNDSINLIAIGKLAGLKTRMFEETGEISKLYDAERFIKTAIAYAARDKDVYLRSLAHNYISQHRFQEAKLLLDSAYLYPDNKRDTELMLFDVAMEIGDYKKADILLGKVKASNDFNYLIRLSKWSDYQGNLEAAIRYMEQALEIAKKGGSISLRVWTLNNLADYYGHAGKIKKSYDSYLKVLRLASDNSYAKKGIAWISYALELNTKEANRIIDSIIKTNKSPDYLLFKAELAAYSKMTSQEEKYISAFIDILQKENYRGMYNAQLIELYANSQPEKALELAHKELVNRPTPMIYTLLALSELKSGYSQKALETIENHVISKVHEPMALYYSALIFKANGLDKKVQKLKKELSSSSFELGPEISSIVEQL